MWIAWLSDDHRHPELLARGLKSKVRMLSLGEAPYPEAEVLVVYANTGPSSRSWRAGLRWLERQRREQKCRLPALIYSFEPQEMLARDFAMVGKDVPGIKFLRLPVAPGEFQRALRELRKRGAYSDEEFRKVLRWYSGWDKEWRRRTHRLSQMIQGLPAGRDAVLKEARDLQGFILDAALDAEEQYLDLCAALEDCDSQEGSRLLEELTRRVVGAPVLPRPDVPPRAMADFDRILIVDDGEFPAGTKTRLQELGYQICGEARDRDEARRMMSECQPSVVLVDYHLGTGDEGQAFMKEALNCEMRPTVVAISRALLRDDELPPGVWNCTGPVRCANPQDLHQVIVGAARQRGASPPPQCGDERPPRKVALAFEECARIPTPTEVCESARDALTAWERAPALIQSAQQELERIAGQGPAALKEMAECLHRWLAEFPSELSWRDMRRLRAQANVNHDWARQSLGCEPAADVLHNTILQATSQFGFRPLSAVASIRQARDKAPALREKMVSRLSALETRLLTETPTPALLKELANALSDFSRSPEPDVARKNWTPDYVLIIEDDPNWRGSLKKLLNDVLAGLTNRADCEIREASSAEKALSRLRELGNPAERDLNFPLVILDLSIPDRPGETAHREHGLKLLREIRRYRIQAAVIVVTAPWQDLDVHQEIVQAGVPEEWILFKDPDWRSRLREKLKNLLEALNRELTVRFPFGAGNTVVVDGVAVQLTPDKYDLYRKLAELSQRSTPNVYFSCNEILGDDEARVEEEEKELQEALFGPEGPWCGVNDPDRQTVIKNIARFWINASAACADPKKALRWFLRQIPPALQIQRSLPNAYAWFPQVHGLEQQWNQLDELAKAEWMNRAFPIPRGRRASSAGKSLSELPKKIYALRAQIYEQLAAVPKYCHPQAIIASTDTEDGQRCYRILGRVIFDKGSTLRRRPLRVLVVENDPVYQSKIKALIADTGHEVRSASNREEAIRLGCDWQPDILCLDLHIPDDANEYVRNPLSGREGNGIEVLRALRKVNVEPKVVVLTHFANDDALRQTAVDLDVRVEDVVAKRGADWKEKLLGSIQGFADELAQGGIMPPSRARGSCTIKVVSASGGSQDKLELEFVGGGRKVFRKNQARLLRALLTCPNQVVPYGKLSRAVYGGGGRAQFASERLKQLVKVVRNEIKKIVRDKTILEDERGQGYRLNCILLDPNRLLRARTGRPPGRPPAGRKSRKPQPGGQLSGRTKTGRRS
jgi:CheY-like chemotaxis protein